MLRRTGYTAVDALVTPLADPEADPVLRRASPAEMRARLGGPAPEQGGGLDAVLARVHGRAVHGKWAAGEGVPVRGRAVADYARIMQRPGVRLLALRSPGSGVA
jgi:hypothetical protein